MSDIVKQNQVKGLIKNLSVKSLYKDFAKIKELLYDLPQTTESIGFLLAIDGENSNEVRSASIKLTKTMALSDGTLFLGEKVGRLTGILAGYEFRNVLFYFPKEEDVVMLQNREPYCSNREVFMLLLKGKMVCLIDLSYHVQIGEGQKLIA